MSVFKQEVITHFTGGFFAHNLLKVRNAMLCVNNIITRLEGERNTRGINALGAVFFASRTHRKVGDGKNGKMRRRYHDTGRNRSVGKCYPPPFKRLV